MYRRECKICAKWGAYVTKGQFNNLAKAKCDTDKARSWNSHGVLLYIDSTHFLRFHSAHATGQQQSHKITTTRSMQLRATHAMQNATEQNTQRTLWTLWKHQEDAQLTCEAFKSTDGPNDHQSCKIIHQFKKFNNTKQQKFEKSIVHQK